jgi:hypothetical protein
MVGEDVVIWDYIDSWLGKIASYEADPGDEGFEVDAAVTARLREVLREVCEESSIFPHISPDGDHGVTAVWHAKKYSLQISVWSDLEIWVFVQSPEISGQAYRFDTEGSRGIKDHLRALSDHVNRINPRWRELAFTTT